MTYAIEFPYCANDTACATVSTWEGWKDCSWHNDACPNFVSAEYSLWCDAENISEREYVTTARYSLVPAEDVGDYLVPVLETDNFEDIVAYIFEGKRGFPVWVYPNEEA